MSTATMMVLAACVAESEPNDEGADSTDSGSITSLDCQVPSRPAMVAGTAVSHTDGSSCSDDQLALLALIIHDIHKQFEGPTATGPPWAATYFTTLPLESGTTVNLAVPNSRNLPIYNFVEELDSTDEPFCQPLPGELDLATMGLAFAVQHHELPESERCRDEFRAVLGTSRRLQLIGPYVDGDDAVVRWRFGARFDISQGALTHYRRVDGLWTFQDLYLFWIA